MGICYFLEEEVAAETGEGIEVDIEDSIFLILFNTFFWNINTKICLINKGNR